ncbi:MAG TPA: hypothetical protein DG761_02810 [Gammaproteobacteria bacterium]|jgi:small-conductance mechanosensitive channel|nr:mechanosensitive ion channel [Arenicellales bacterium]MDP6552657.1 mechanosensitive ion channel [Arenicellales bacterium]MDP6791203.1 mechanosensitive ion channel [Arenicellales bacterium]MDP6917820.1 mechanosensitive ion channel [Arenicellales bacterium]HCX86933.1 hypothetical protein [Gammaproteobacteria bacterium]|tara:strand:- start:5092 stop:7350 length:2259 start_codon:yes stop_codon:yes gene_type:complete
MKNYLARLLAGLVVVPLFFLWSGDTLGPATAFAQDVVTADPTAVLDQDLSADERQELLARLSDEQVRAMVWNLISTSETESAPADPVVMELTTITNRFRDGMAARLQQVPGIASVPAVVAAAMTPPGAGAGTLWLVTLYLAGILLIGWIAQMLFKKVSRRIPETLSAASDKNFPVRLGRRLALLIYDVFPPVVFTVAAYTAFLLAYRGHEPNRLLMMGLLAGILVAWLLSQLVNFVFSPNRPDCRLTALNDENSKLLSSRVSWVFIGGSALYFFQAYLGAVVSPFEKIILVGSINLVGGLTLMGLIIVVVWMVRQPVSALLLSGNPPGLLRKTFAGIWPLVGTASVVLLTLIGLFAAVGLGQPGVLLSVLKTLLLMLVAPLLLGAVGPFVREWGAPEPSEDPAVPQRQAARDGVVQIIRLIILGASVLLLGRIWNVDLVALTTSQLGEQITQSTGQILVTVVIAYLVWTITKRWIASQDNDPMDSDGQDSDAHAGSDPGGQGLSRIATVLPLLRGFLLVTIVTVSVMVVLASLGVNIGPLIAAASVLGLAIGFGAQSLVADIISGIFFLVDDAFRKGEYIDVGGNTGTVEQISVRSMQLRHHNGPIHTIPYSQINTLTNFSRDWVIMKFELRIPFEEDVEKVRKLIKKVGQRLLEDPEHGPQFLEPLKSQGVNRMDDSAFVVRCKFSAKPGNQWALRRVAYAKIQSAFAEAGIKFAPKRVVVEAITPALAAAGAAAQEPLTENPPTPGDDRG